MAFSRYRSSPILALGSQYGTNTSIAMVRKAVKQGLIPIVNSFVLNEGQRLDQLAGLYYKDSRYWWIIAAASEVGWGLQVPPGVIIKIPDINAVSSIVG